MRLRRGTTAQLVAGNKIFAQGEVVVELAADGHVVGTKVGDSTTPWNDLPYLGSGQIATIAGLQAALDAAVHQTGAETITGVKTFSNSPVIPPATTSSQAVNKGQLDSTVGGVVDWGYCQSELGHEAWTSFDATKIRGILQGMKDSGATRVRIAGWWGAIHPVTTGTPDWDGLDRAMSLCAEYGIAPLLVITGDPIVAARTPTVTTAQYGTLCGQIAARYGASGTNELHHYEIWNEYNHAAFAAPFTFNVATYNALLTAASTAIRAADSQSFIISVGLMSTADYAPNDIAPNTFLQGIYSGGNKNRFDAVAFHWYTNSADFTTWNAPTLTETFYLQMLAMRATMVTNGDTAKKIWITEFGMAANAPFTTNTRYANLMKQVEMMKDLPWVGPFFFFNYTPAINDGGVEFGYAATNFDLTKRQPIWDYLASINAAVPGKVAARSVGGNELDVSGTPTATTIVKMAADRSLSVVEPSTADDLITLGTYFRPDDQTYPAPGASPAALTTDGGIAAGQPSPTTGLRFVPWTDLTAFQYQGLNMVAASAAMRAPFSLGAGAMGINADTPRKWNYGSYAGDFMGGTIDLRFDTDSTRVIPVYAIDGAYLGTSYHDMHHMVDDRGPMKHLSNGTANNGLPRTSTGGSGVYRRELTFLERRWRRHRTMIPGYGYFLGVWVDTLATIQKPAPKLLFLHNMDSWNEPYGASFSDNPGGGFPSGSYACLGQPQYSSFVTGQCHGTVAQGGTGEFNGNGGGTATGYTGTDASALWTDSRVNDLITKFGPQYPIVVDVGGWNDNTGGGMPYKDTYKARVIARYIKLFANSTAAGRDIKAINVGIQPVSWVPGDGSARDLGQQGQNEAAVSFPNQVLGSIPLNNMWTDVTTSGQRSLYCLSQSGLLIHLNMSGNIAVAGWMWPKIGKLKVSKQYLNSMLTQTAT